jgi:hypothetical protein
VAYHVFLACDSFVGVHVEADPVLRVSALLCLQRQAGTRAGFEELGTSAELLQTLLHLLQFAGDRFVLACYTRLIH